MDRWWIDEPVVLGSCNPSDADLKSFWRDGFSVMVCLLDLQEQSPNYDTRRACAAGWEWHNIPVPDFAAPTVAQIEQFLTLVRSSIPQKKMVVHCRAGIGRTGTMAAAYWIAKGLSWQTAIAHTRERRRYAVENRQQLAILREYETTRDRTSGGSGCEGPNKALLPTSRPKRKAKSKRRSRAARG